MTNVLAFKSLGPYLDEITKVSSTYEGAVGFKYNPKTGTYLASFVSDKVSVFKEGATLTRATLDLYRAVTNLPKT